MLKPLLLSRLLVDSSVWIDYLAGRNVRQTSLLEDAFSSHEICLCDLIAIEVLQGIRDDSQYKKARDLLLEFTFITTHGKRLAMHSANNYRTLRKRGITLRSTVDCIIATAAIESRVPLLANDRDYHHFATHLGLVLA